MFDIQNESVSDYSNTAYVAERVLNALDKPKQGFGRYELPKITRKVLNQLRQLFQCSGPVIIYPSSGIGAWNGAFVNTLSANDLILICDTGDFSNKLADLAIRLGLRVEILPGDHRYGPQADFLEQRLKQDYHNNIKAICVAHSDTSTGLCTNIPSL